MMPTFDSNANFSNIENCNVADNKVTVLDRWSATLKGKLLALYEFGDSGDLGADTLGNYELTNSGCVQTTFVGGDGIAVDSVSDRITGAPAIPIGGTNDWSVSCWFNSANASGGAQYIVSKADGGTGKTFYAFTNGGVLNVYVNGAVLIYSAAVSDSTDYHLVITSKYGVGQVVYLNASPVGTGSQTGSIQYSASQNFEINSRLAGFGMTSAKIAQVAVWDEALTQSDVTELYNSGSQLEYGTYAYGDFLIHDSGETYQDATVGKYWDNSTADQTVTGSPTITFQYADSDTDLEFADAAAVEAGASWNGSWLSLAELRLVEDSQKRFRYLKCRFTPTTAADSFDSYSCDTGTLDLLGPTAPTDVKAFKSAYGAELIDLAIPLTTGVEQGAAGYNRTTYKIYNSATAKWYVRLTDGQWQEETGSEVAAELYAHQDDAEETHIVAGHPSLSANITKIRLCSWDNNNNYTCGDDVAVTDAEGTASPPSAPGLTVADDETGTSFTATITGIDTGVDRAVRYRSVESDEWVAFPAEGERDTGSGDVQVTGLSAGGYEVEAFAVDSDVYGSTSVRKYVKVTDGSAVEVDAFEAAKWESRLSRSAHRVTLHSANDATFDPSADTAITQTFDDVGSLRCLAPRDPDAEINLGNGKYQKTDLVLYVSAADLAAYATEPKDGDQATYADTGELFDVVGVRKRFDRASWQLVLRRAD